MIVLHHSPAPAPAPDHPRRCDPTVHIGGDTAEIAAELLAESIRRCVRKTGRCRLALSGGSTPGPIFARLARTLPHSIYPQLRVTWADERVFPVASQAPGDWQAFDAESNLRLAYEHWLAHVPMPAHHVLPLALSTDAKAETLRFGYAFRQAFDGAIDVALLGVGPDGHVASLFPGHPALEVDDLCMAIHDSPKPPLERITLGLPVLDRARVVVVAASGANKAQVLQDAWSGANEGHMLPVARVRGGGDLHWVLDGAAGQGIVQAATAPPQN